MDSSGAPDSIIPSGPPEGGGALVNANIKVSTIIDLPAMKKTWLRRRKVFVAVTVEDRTERTRDAKATSGTVAWGKDLSFPQVALSAAVKLEVFACHRTSNESLGRVEVTLSSLLHESRSSSASSFVLFSLAPAPTLSPASPALLYQLNGSSSSAKLIFEINSDAAADAPMQVASMHDILTQDTTYQDPVKEAFVGAQEALTGADTVAGEIHTLSESRSGGELYTTEYMNQAADTWSSLLSDVVSKIGVFTEVVDKIAEVHTYAKMAWTILSAIPKVIQGQSELDSSVPDLLKSVTTILDITWDVQREQVDLGKTKVLARIAQQVTECAYFIAEYAKAKGFAHRTLKHIFSSTRSEVQGYTTKLASLKDEFYGRVTTRTTITVMRVLGVVEETRDVVQDISQCSLLCEMPYAAGAHYDPEKGYFPGTRTGILDEISNWINSEDAPRVCLLTGGAGAGKSAIIHSIASRFHALERLGSSFCFRRGQRELGLDRLFSTMSCDLADKDRAFCAALLEAVKDNRSERTSLNLMIQFSCFKQALSSLVFSGPLVIVIDAPDESGDAHSREALLRILSNECTALSSNVRILVSSRPEHDVLKTIQTSASIKHCDMDCISKDDTDSDISTFIHSMLPTLSPGNSATLIEKAGGIFQWAYVTCAYIQRDTVGTNIKKRFQYSLSFLGTLDDVYKQILTDMFKDDRSGLDAFKEVMAIIFTIFTPLPIGILNCLEQHGALERSTAHSRKSLSGHNVNEVLNFMGSLLKGVDNTDEPVIPRHVSFQDFLLDQRSGEFYIDLSMMHNCLAAATLGILKHGLHFNMGNIQTSYKLNDDTISEDVVSRLGASGVTYSSLYWVQHLKETSPSSFWVDEVTELLETKFLYWLEVMSLINSAHIARENMVDLLPWCKKLPVPLATTKLTELVPDAHKFVAHFSQIITESLPHIYLSALALSPTESCIFQEYGSHLQSVPTVVSGDVKSWPSGQKVFSGHTSSVTSVAFSPDGTQIVSGLYDSTVRLWDVSSGKQVGDPLQGHTDLVTSVAFSSDETQIVSGSWDNTVRLWDVASGKQVGDPLQGHTGWVNSVAFSPDGTQIVSGSADNTVHLWDVASRNQAGNPLQGHTDMVFTIAFSPDGTQIVSGSADKTVHLWDVASGKQVGDPLQGHTASVISVAFSPDGTQIVSGSRDNTVHLWDVASEKQVGDPLQGHTDPVSSIAFSPDGTQIVSVSYDGTIRIWDI
ncbi:hypothetical protein OF83DRAFT_1270414, partial [Amylostereum chailletii]